MGILLANHCDEYNQKLVIALLRKNLPITTVISNNISFFSAYVEAKKTTILDIYQFYYKEKILALNENNPRALTAQEIETFFATESEFLKISDRLAYKAISHHERLELYYELLLYWLTYFDNHKIDLVVFSQSPHTGFDNILYAVAQKKGIPLLVSIPTLISDTILMQPRIWNTKKIPSYFQKNTSTLTLKKMLKPVVAQSIKSQGNWLKIGKDINSRVVANNKGNVVVRTLLRGLKLFVTNPTQIVTSCTEYSKNSGFVFNGYHTKAKEFVITCLHYPAKKALAKYYQSVAITPNLKQKYIYFSLHYQPERTTMPEGGVYEWQYLAIRTVALALPKGWKLLVKDHPRQFSLNDVRTNNFRSKQFYTKITALPNTFLVPFDMDSKELIQKAQLTASIQGSVGWESLLERKPTLVFAYAWYAACNSCFVVTSTKSCIAAIGLALAKKPTDVYLDLLKFLVYTQDHFVTSAFLEQPARESLQDYAVLLQNGAEEIERYYVKTSKKLNR